MLAQDVGIGYLMVMARSDQAQLNIRSRYARERAAELVRATGMTAAQVVEEALRAYNPPKTVVPEGMARRGPILVGLGGVSFTREEAIAALDDAREDRF